MAWNEKQTEKNRFFFQSFRHAVNGLLTVFKEERNMKYHVFIGVCAIFMGFICQLTLNEWLWLVCAIVLVFIAEVINTAFEGVVDMITNKTYHPTAKKVKDMTAGMVLITALFALFVGLVLFLPKLYVFFIGS